MASVQILPVEISITVHTGERSRYWPSVCGAAMRAAARGERVLVVQLMAGGVGQGPNRPTKMLSGLEWLRPDIARSRPLTATEEERRSVRDLWHRVRATASAYQQVVVDGLQEGLTAELVGLAEIEGLIAGLEGPTEVVLCGPQLPESLVNSACRVSEWRASPATTPVVLVRTGGGL